MASQHILDAGVSEDGPCSQKSRQGQDRSVPSRAQSNEPAPGGPRAALCHWGKRGGRGGGSFFLSAAEFTDWQIGIDDAQTVLNLADAAQPAAGGSFLRKPG